MPSKTTAVRLAIVIPTYNEAENIPKLIAAIDRAIKKTIVQSCTVLIVDDSSPDGTATVVRGLQKQYTSQLKLKLLVQPVKNGLGQAYINGFRLVLDHNITHILQMDADLSHNPKYIPEFLQALDSNDLVIGSRYIPGGATPDWSAHRKLVSHLGNLYAQLFLGQKIHDYTGGYNLYSLGLLQTIDLTSIKQNGYGFLIDLKYRALLRCSSVQEVPIVFRDRTHGKSKLPKRTIFSNLLLVPLLRFGRLTTKL